MIGRLLATLRLDVLTQDRQRFYHASVLVLLTIGALVLLARPTAGFALPAILLTNMLMVTFAFLGGLLLLEKGDHTLEGQLVSPLRPDEYLVSKIVSLGMLATAENALIVWLALATGLVDRALWGWVLGATALSAVLYTLLGLLTVIRCDSIEAFFMPMIGATAVLELPALIAFGMPEGAWLYPFPTLGPMMLFQTAFDGLGAPSPRTPAMLVYAVVYPLVWIGVAGGLARRSLRRFVTETIGTS